MLVVSGDAVMTRSLSVALAFEGYEVCHAADGSEALPWLLHSRGDAILFDTDAPETDGVALMGDLRSRGITAPVLLVTECAALRDIVSGLAAGADDYIVKPFDVEEVLARLWAILRRSRRATGESGERQTGRLEFHGLVVDESTREVWAADEPVSLSPKEFDLLRYFVANAGIVLTKRQILDRVWSDRTAVSGNAVESCVSALRRKLDCRGPCELRTLRGVGYVLRAAAPSRPTRRAATGVTVQTPRAG
ncbi:response regulator transcription factor [Mycolicibacterium madagascariense]|uniref:response regulator transcription factor n=1 Tax=Mycolicibacterium madagascariense TaxID=212765 RepID=UPI001FE67CCD